MIKDKDYKLEYEQLIQRAKDSNRTKKDSSVYYERHHILPKCMGGLNEDRNYVLLTYKEHVLAHWLLHKMYPEEDKLLYAFNRITNSCNVKDISILDQFWHEIECSRKELSQRLSNMNKSNWSDKDYANRVKEFLAKVNRDPVIRKQKSVKAKVFWNSEKGKALLSKNTTKQMSDPKMKIFIQQQRVLNFYKSLRDFGFAPTAYSWDLTCKEYALNMPKYTHTYSLDTVSWLFGTFENMVKQAGFVTNGMESLYGAD